jgi:hypothetical protein
MSLVNYHIFMDMTNDLDLKAYVMICICFSGMVVSIVSNCFLAPWKEILLLYCHLDSITPVLVSACIAFYSLMSFFTLNLWQSKVYVAAFPLWVIYFTGNLRVMLVYVKWRRWEVIIYKLVVLTCGIISFLIGFEYMMGKYKIFQGYYLFVSLEVKLRELSYLFVFGAVELFFEMFRKLSEFDQTFDLKYEYTLEDPHNKHNEMIVQT